MICEASKNVSQIIRQDYIEEIHDVIPQDRSSEYDQNNCCQFPVLTDQGMEIFSQLINMENIRIFYGIKFFFRERFQVVYIKETVEPDDRDQEDKPIHSGT